MELGCGGYLQQIPALTGHGETLCHWQAPSLAKDCLEVSGLNLQAEAEPETSVAGLDSHF